MTTLSSSLGGGAPSGLDAAGLAFGMAYQKSAQALLEAGASLVNASRNVGFGVGMSATNYSQADAASTIGGGSAPLTAAEKPGEFGTPSCPSSLGGGAMPPFLWSVLENFIPESWPDGDPDRLHASATAWQSFASTIDGMAGELSGPSGVIGAQQIPEGGAMTSAIAELSRSLSGVATEARNLATQTEDFADDVQSTQDAIRDLCDRISPSGFFDGIKAVFSGDALDELKEIAHDVQQVLENFGRQVDGRISLMESLITALDDTVVSLQQGARREFTHYLGDDVGGALASAFEFQSNVNEGAIKAALQTVVGIQQLDPTRFASDFDGAKAAWGGVLETVKYATPAGLAADPSGAFEHGKDMLGGITHAEDWRADRPGLGLGGVLFEAGSAATGVGAAKTGLRGVSAAADAGEAGQAVRAVAGAAESTAPIAGRASEIAGKLDDLTTLTKDMPSGAASGVHGPTLPPSLTEPHVPRVAEAPKLPETSVPRSSTETTGPRAVPDGAGPRPVEVPSQHVPEMGGRAEVSPQHVPEAGVPSAEPAIDYSGGAPTESLPEAPSTLAPEPATPGSAGGTHATETSPAGSTNGLNDTQHPPTSHTTSTSGHADASPESSPHTTGHETERGDHQSTAPHDAIDHPDTRTSHSESITHDPVHSTDRSGDGWHRIDDGAIDPDYGRPLENYWESGDYPQPGDVNRDTFQLVERPDEPYGHDEFGTPLSKEEYDSRYNMFGDEGQLYQHYPPNDGALPQSRVVYDSGDAYLRDYGQFVDRIGGDTGKYLGVMPDGVAPSFEMRSLPVDSLLSPYSSFRLANLPEGWTVEVSEIAPAFGRDGGGLQVLVYDDVGEVLRVKELLENGVLERWP